MQNHVRNTMHFRNISYNEGPQSYGRFCPSAVENTEKIEN